MPNPFTASWTVLSCKEPVVGSHRTPTPESVGTHSMSSCKHFALKSGKSRNTPVTLPPGRARLLTKPLATGSLSRSIAITGMLVVAPAAAWTAGGAAPMMPSAPLFTQYVPIGKTDDYLEARVALVVRATQALADCRNAHIHNRRFPRMQQSDLATFRRLLRMRRERPGYHRAAEQPDEIAPLHCPVPPVLLSKRNTTRGTAALRDFNSPYVGLWLNASHRHARDVPTMSASHPITTELVRHNEPALRARSGLPRCRS